MRPTMHDGAKVMILQVEKGASICLEEEMENGYESNFNALHKTTTVVVTNPKRSATFDYSMLSPALARDAQETAARIRTTMRAAIVEVGRDLRQMKQKLVHGTFAAWLDAEFDMSANTARNYMVAAELAEGWPKAAANLTATVMYALA